MATVILLRHARSAANGSGVLAGRSPGVELDETGQQQATSLVGRLADVPLAALVRSPLLRCGRTLEPLAAQRELEPLVDEDLAEVDYGDWTGKKLSDLGEEPLWRVVQNHPSAAQFPGGESLAAVQARAVAAVRRHDARIAGESGDGAVWLLCTHGDVIKSVLADALGQHLDAFQRIVVDPGSVSVVRYTTLRPFVLRTNDNGGDLTQIVPPPKDESAESDDADRTSGAARDTESDAPVGGSTGSS